MSDLARYYHATLFSSSITTLTRAINRGNLVTWPDIEKVNFKSVLRTTDALEKGHLNHESSYLQSTICYIQEEDNFPKTIKANVYNILL